MVFPPVMPFVPVPLALCRPVGFGADDAAMGDHDRVGDREAQAGTVLLAIGRKRREEAGAVGVQVDGESGVVTVA